MKQFAAIGMLILLLYHMGAASFAVLFFENYYTTTSQDRLAEKESVIKYAIPSLPYTSHWESDQIPASVLREGDQFFNLKSLNIQSDTLYMVVQENLSAKERFFSLVQGVQDLADRGSESSPVKKDWLRGLKHLSKVYSFSTYLQLPSTFMAFIVPLNEGDRPYFCHYQSWVPGQVSPPPELLFSV